MEDVLEVYKLPYDAHRPLICMDEMPKQLLADKQEPLPCQVGTPTREDYEYKRNGVADLFMVFEPLAGKRFVEVTEKRRKIEWATVMKQVSDVFYPQAEKILVVLDNLNTHSPSAFYETFEPEEARRLVERFEFHFTPKHGSWLNMAEIELSVFGRTMKNYIAEMAIFESEAQALTIERNNSLARVDWQFRSADARIKLKQLYPSISA